MKSFCFVLMLGAALISCNDQEGETLNLSPCADQNPTGTPEATMLANEFAGPFVSKPGDFLQVSKNGICNKFEVQANTYQDTIYVFAKRGEEHITFKLKFNGVEDYNLGNSGNAAFYYVTVGQDVIVATYKLTGQGLLEIISFDDQVLQGRFNFSTKLDYRYTDSPAEVIFQDGVFRVQVNE